MTSVGKQAGLNFPTGRNQMSPNFLGMDALTITKPSFDAQATWAIVYLAYFWHAIHVFLYDQALTDIQLTGAGSEWLYCAYN